MAIYLLMKKQYENHVIYLDKLTRLWLIHFNTRQIRDISLDVNAYLHLIFQK